MQIRLGVSISRSKDQSASKNGQKAQRITEKVRQIQQFSTFQQGGEIILIKYLSFVCDKQALNQQ